MINGQSFLNAKISWLECQQHSFTFSRLEILVKMQTTMTNAWSFFKPNGCIIGLNCTWNKLHFPCIFTYPDFHPHLHLMKNVSKVPSRGFYKMQKEIGWITKIPWKLDVKLCLELITKCLNRSKKVLKLCKKQNINTAKNLIDSLLAKMRKGKRIW